MTSSLGKGLASYSPRAKFSPLPIFVKKILLEHSHAHLFTQVLSIAAFVLQWQNRVAVAETVRSAKLKYFLSGLLQKKFADLWSKGIRS